MNWNDNWDNGANTHDDIEAAIKAKIQEIQDAIASGETTMGQVGQQLATLQQSINGLVPNTRTINGKRLNTNVTLKTSDLENDSGYITEDDLPEGVTVDEELDDESGHAISNAAVCEGLAAKADDNVVVKSISVNGQTPQTPTQGNVNINVQGTPGADGITPHIGQNGHWWIGDENDSENDTGVPAQGPAGESITDADLTIGNALNGQGDVLGMQGAMQMKANIDSLFTSLNRLYTKLGNMAFWDVTDKTAAAPTALDWQVPQFTVTLDKTALSANAMITDANDNEITGTSVSVDQGSGLTLKIKPRTGYSITTASATIGGVSQTLTESGGIYTLAIASVTSAITIVFSVTADSSESVSVTLKKVTAYGAEFGTAGNIGGSSPSDTGVPMTLGNISSSTPECSLSSTSYVDGSPFSSVVTPATGFAIFSVKVMKDGSDITSTAYTPATHAIYVGSPNSTLTIEVIVAAATNGFFIDGSFFGCKDGQARNFSAEKAGQIVTDSDWCCMSDFVQIPSGSKCIKWWLGDDSNKPYDSNAVGALVSHSRTLILYDADFVPVKWLTYWDSSKPYRTWDIATNAPTAKYVRASFMTSLLSYGKIEFTPDSSESSTNYTQAWPVNS